MDFEKFGQKNIEQAKEENELEKIKKELDWQRSIYASAQGEESVSRCKVAYEAKLFKYKKTIIKDIESRGLRGEDFDKEASSVIKFFSYSEAAKLYDLKTEKKNKNIWNKFSEWYNKKEWDDKVAMSGLLAAGSLIPGIRTILFGGAKAIATEGGIKKLSEIGRISRAETEAEQYLKQTKEMDLENRVNHLDFILTKDIESINSKLKKRQLESIIRKGVAAFAALPLVGTLIGAPFMLGGGLAFLREKLKKDNKNNLENK